MTDVLVIPAYQRAEFLAVCLECISKCPEVRSLAVLVCVDNHAGSKAAPEISEVVGRFGALRPRMVVRPPTAWRGNSRNVLLGLREALLEQPDFVYYVEEDVFVAEDFFRWHGEVHRQRELFCSIGSANPHLDPETETGLGIEDYYLSPTDYAGLGVCFPVGTVKLIVKHAVPQYFGNLSNYLRHNFPRSRFGEVFAEQDGLIRRILEVSSLEAAWPGVPRAFHAGFHGYNRPGKPLRGPIDVRIRALKDIMFDRAQLNARSSHYKDIAPCALGGHRWQEQRLKVLPNCMVTLRMETEQS